MNWLAFASRLPEVIKASMIVVDRLKVPGKTKKEKVIEAIPAAIPIVEQAAAKDLINDPAVAELLSVYIDAQHAADKAKAALQSGILVKKDAQD